MATQPSRSRKTPLAQRTETGQVRWMKKELNAIINTQENNAYGFTAERGLGFAQIKETVEKLKEAFPVRHWTSPSGKVWEGTELPECFLTTSLAPENLAKMGGNLFNMAIVLDNQAQLIPWFLASGFDPRAYNPHTKNAPIGGMAYTGKHQALAICREAGCDLTLLIEPHHYPNMDATKVHTLVGTTLLHRVAERFQNIPDGEQVMHELLKAGLDPYATNAVGESVLTWCRGGSEDVLKRWIANLEADQLAKTVPTVDTVRSGPRL